MNDFLKQIEAYSNDKLDKFLPTMNTQNYQNQQQIQLRVAEQVSQALDKDLTLFKTHRKDSHDGDQTPNDDQPDMSVD